jgi:MFS family permease
VFAAFAGGWISDLCGRRWGIRGRVWWLFICQMLGGVTCLALGLAQESFTWTMVRGLSHVLGIYLQPCHLQPCVTHAYHTCSVRWAQHRSAAMPVMVVLCFCRISDF